MNKIFLTNVTKEPQFSFTYFVPKKVRERSFNNLNSGPKHFSSIRSFLIAPVTGHIICSLSFVVFLFTVCSRFTLL